MAVYEQSWYWNVYASVRCIGAFVTTILCFFHYFRMAKQLKSTKRKVKSIISAICTAFAILGFTLFMAGSVLISFTVVKDACWLMVMSLTALYSVAKYFMYTLFLLRLDLVYNGSVYQYNKTYLIVSGVIAWVFGIFLLIFHAFTMTVDEAFIYDEVGYALRCNGVWNEIAGGLSILLDLTYSIGFIVAFVRPLKKITAKLEQVSGGMKLLRAGSKAMILTSAATTSTLFIILLLLVATQTGSISSFLIPFDVIVNVVSLMLMTPYYAQSKWFRYEVLCCCIERFCKCSNKIMTSVELTNYSSVQTQSPRHIQSPSHTQANSDEITTPTSI